MRDFLTSDDPCRSTRPRPTCSAAAPTGARYDRSGACPAIPSFIIARRELTRDLDLQGRVFLHSYDYREDPSNRLLETLLTAPQVVGQWINMEHYFSTVDNEVYGSGSKIYHNVVGRLGIMSGPWSDLRLGLARQTVMNGEMPYHEPMRLLDGHRSATGSDRRAHRAA